MVYNALAAKWHGGYERKSRFCIFHSKNSAMQRQRHHTPGNVVTHFAAQYMNNFPDNEITERKSNNI
jgi:hypothetical protein